MKWWTWATVVASVGALAACSGGDTTGTGGAGGDTTSGTGQQSVSSSSTGGAGGTGTGGTGGTGTGGTGGSGSTCDDIGICQDPDPAVMTCSTCAQQGDCSDEVAACMADMSCAALTMCFGMCMPNDQACLMNCAMMNPAGYQVYNQIQICVVCGNCRMSCSQFVGPLMCPP